MKTYSELIQLPTYEERYEYLRTAQLVGDITFGGSRWLNQQLYNSKEWHDFRRRVIIRDRGCDLAMDGYDIIGKVIVHHLNAITKEQVLNRDPAIFDLNNVVCVSFDTHQAIHYGNELKKTIFVERKPNDTIPWR